MTDGPLPAGVQPLCDFNSSSSSSSSAPAVQTGLIIVDGPSPADGLGCYGSAASAEMSPDSSHTHHDAPSSVCTGTGCTGSRSDESPAGRPIFQISALVLCAIYTVFLPIWTGMQRLGVLMIVFHRCSHSSILRASSILVSIEYISYYEYWE